MKNESDFGYFGKGTTGYAHYTETHKQCHPDVDANLFSGSNCNKTTDFMFWFLAKLGPFVFGGFFVFFLMIHEVMSADEMVQVLIICGIGFVSSVILAILWKDVLW